MSKTPLAPVRHAAAHEHARAFHLLAGPIHRLGVALRRNEGSGSDADERLLVARSSSDGFRRELELRLPHPDPTLSAPRLVLRGTEGEDGPTLSATVAYLEQGLWRVALSDQATFTSVYGCASRPFGWMLVENDKMHVTERDLPALANGLGWKFLGPSHRPDKAAMERLRHLNDLARYRELRAILHANGVAVRRPDSGHSITNQPGRFLRSPVHQNKAAAAVFEISKPDLRDGQRRPLELTFRMGRTNPDLFTPRFTAALDGDWIQSSGVWATSASDRAFVGAMGVEEGVARFAHEDLEANVERLLFLYKTIALEAELEKLARR